MAESQRFPPAMRLRRREDFERAFANRVSEADAWLILYARENHASRARLGLSVPRRIGGSVERNRWKRLIREAFRLSRPQIPQGIDWIVIPRARRKPTLETVRLSLVRLTARLARRLARGRPIPGNGRPSPPGSPQGD